MNLALLEPALIVSEGGTVSVSADEESATTTPPSGAVLEIVTVHVPTPPGLTFCGEQDSDLTESAAEAFSESWKDLLVPLNAAVIVAFWA
jgi:hypothetical protein